MYMYLFGTRIISTRPYDLLMTYVYMYMLLVSLSLCILFHIYLLRIKHMDYSVNVYIF